MNFRQKHAIIIAAIIGAVAAIIAALIMTLKVKTFEVIITNMETKQPIYGNVFIDESEEGKPSYPDKPVVLKIKRGNRFIRVESDGYEPRIVPIKSIAVSEPIELKPIVSLPPPECIPLSLAGWSSWGGVSVTKRDNANIINGTVRGTGGLNNTALNKDLSGKTLYLYFSNSTGSTFDQERMVKLTVNKNDILLEPNNRSLIFGEYLSAEDTPPNQGVEYTIPNDFDGKLGFVFYQAELKNLQITAMYK